MLSIKLVVVVWLFSSSIHSRENRRRSLIDSVSPQEARDAALEASESDRQTLEAELQSARSELEKCGGTVERLEGELELALAALENQCTETIERSVEVQGTKKELLELECKFSLQECLYKDCKESSEKKSYEFEENNFCLSHCLHNRNREIQELLRQLEYQRHQLEYQRIRIEMLAASALANEAKFLERKAQWNDENRMLNERIIALLAAATNDKERDHHHHRKSTGFHKCTQSVPVRYRATHFALDNTLSNNNNNTTSDYEPQQELSDDSADETNSEEDTLQRISWFVRHSGTTPLRCNMFKRFDGSFIVDECISLRDDNKKSCYTSYVHLLSRQRSGSIKRILRCVAGIHKLKVIPFPIHEVERSRHFWVIAAGIQRASSGLTIETTYDAANSRLFGKFSRYIYVPQPAA